MSAAKALREAAAALETRNHSPGPNTSQLRARASKGNDMLAQIYNEERVREAAEKAGKGARILDQWPFRQQPPRSHPRALHSNLKWVWEEEEAETAPVKIDQDLREVNTTGEQSPKPYTIQIYPNTNDVDNKVRAWLQRLREIKIRESKMRERKIRERIQAAERAKRASRTLQQVVSSASAGGYSPLALRMLLSKTRRKCKGLPTQQGPQQTSFTSHPYPHSSRTRDGGNIVGLTAQGTGRNSTMRILETSNLTESADVAEVTAQGHHVTSPGAGMLDSNTIFPSPPQSKRKRYTEDDPTEDEPLSKRR
ncbi:hypothetical protein F4803DRAFT_556033 [Xylaria telfairii]|nr:hypothetical protein F4803DRAFT_556033 [Xylaria telfairii]